MTIDGDPAARPAGRHGRPGGRRPAGHPAPARAPATAPSGTSPGRRTGSTAPAGSSGWEAALREAGAEVPPVVPADWSAASGYRVGRCWRGSRRSPRSSPANDHLALGLLRGAARAGRRVPRGRQRRRLRRRARGGVLHPAADHRAARFPRGGPARARLLLGPDRRRAGAPSRSRAQMPCCRPDAVSSAPPASAAPAGFSEALSRAPAMLRRTAKRPPDLERIVIVQQLSSHADDPDCARRRRRLRHAVRSRRRGPGRTTARSWAARSSSTRTPCSTGALPGRRPPLAAGLGAAGARATTSRCCAPRCPPRSPPPGVDPAARRRHRHRLHRLHDGARPRPTAPRCASCRSSPTGRTPTSSSGATTPPSRRPTGSTSWPRERGEPWLPRYGGLISSEWEFAKGLQLLEEAPEVYAAMEHWVEAADWIVWQLTGSYVRNACTAGYKGIRQDGALPVRGVPAPRSTPAFERFVADKLEHPHRPARRRAAGCSAPRPRRGPGCPRASRWRSATSTRTSPRPPREAIEPGQLVAIMGTSTCHVMNGDRAARGAGHVRRGRRRHRRRACGATRPGRAASATSSAGSSSTACRPATTRRPRRRASPCTSCSPSWPPRRRSASTGWSRSTGTAATARCWSTTSCPASSSGQTLATRPEDTYRALLEATAFGTRTIIEAFDDSGVPVTELVVAGGLLKNALLMQIYADVTGLPLSTIGSAQGPALGSAIHAAVAAGAYPDIRAAAEAMGSRAPRRLPAGSGATSRPTTSSTPSTSPCTTTSAAAPTT